MKSCDDNGWMRENGGGGENKDSDRTAVSQTFTACISGIKPVTGGSGETEESTLAEVQRCSFQQRDGPGVWIYQLIRLKSLQFSHVAILRVLTRAFGQIQPVKLSLS